MTRPIFQVDAFTDTPFHGNPAAVVVLTSEQPAAAEFLAEENWPVETRWMQQLGGEMNLSETAFVLGQGNRYQLRWFTPAVEVDLCGHATLASAHILGKHGFADDSKPIEFYTRSGLLTTEVSDGLIEMDFPAEPAADCDPEPELLRALGIEKPVNAGRNRFDWLVEVEDETALATLSPNFPELAKIKTRGIIVTCRSSSPGYDFSSRFFGPAAGIDEDPVTGSAHCCLAPYWSERLGRESLTAYQASQRGGHVRTRVVGDRVKLAGPAITVFQG
ncbi:MAG: hypothetical protein CMJ78_19235, partial [Planctomycetaceae bacterium]|nr:hypothetical protein [Planctomycetaceae bacterium]